MDDCYEHHDNDICIESDSLCSSYKENNENYQQYFKLSLPFVIVHVALEKSHHMRYMYRDVHKKLTHFFYNFHRPKRRKDDFADTKRQCN